jgi:mannose-6-phosphate isomerase
LAAVDFERGPVSPQKPQKTDRPEVSRLVRCDRFVIDRWQFESPLSTGGDDRCHIIVVLEGALRIEGDPAGAELICGRTALVPASLGAVVLRPRGRTVLLDAYLP